MLKSNVKNLSEPRTRNTVGPLLLVTPWYKPAVGGVAAVADHLHCRLNESGVETHLLVCDQKASLKGIETDPEIINVWRFQVPDYLFHRFGLKPIVATILRVPRAIWNLRQFIRAHRVRTVIVLYPFGYAWPFFLLRRFLRIRLIMSLHGNDTTRYDDESVVSRWLLRQLLRCSDAIVVCADHLGQKAQEIVSDRKLPIRMIPNCVNVRYFVPPPPEFNRSASRPTLVHVSNFSPKKCTLDIIEAFSIAKIPANSRLVMVGAGPDLEAAINCVQSLGLSDRVEFVGVQRNVRPYLWQADLFIMASDDEGAPLALLEAMACGLAWVSTAWGAAAMLPPGECGLVVPPRSPQQIAAAITELMNDPQRRCAMGRRARYRAESDFGEDKYVQRHVQLIREIEAGELNPGFL
jgi:glycosyltransferase involved in cell wall biosynthesis